PSHPDEIKSLLSDEQYQNEIAEEN
ncbi:TPA: glycine cleavage system protein H, partial [Legionella pneumophila subsp. pneumophila]|nr:glycine cleavage system protein H [Legionella pneumophila subsp. pneumophila]